MLRRSRRRRIADFVLRRPPATLTLDMVDVVVDVYDARTGHFLRTEHNGTTQPTL